MRRSAGVHAGLALVAALMCLNLTNAQEYTPSLDEAGFLRATSGRPLTLPADHAAHPATRTEWWYFTGPLSDESGRRYGFQATWFRRALVREPAERESPLLVRDVLMFHGALTDLSSGRLLFSEASSRAFPPWAWASEDGLEVRVFENVLSGPGSRSKPRGSRAGAPASDDEALTSLTLTAGEATLELELTLGASVVLNHGVEPGLSLKGSEPGQASWYYSLPDIPAVGRLRMADGETRRVSGRAWMDHEFGSSQLDAELVGWDWLSVVLDDGSVLMVYLLRDAEGLPQPASSGTLLVPGSPARHLARGAFTLRARSTWTSPDSGISYPSGWTLEVPDAQLSLNVTPLLEAQELQTRSTGVTYWEGLCRFTGQRAGAPVTGEGYVELVGYGTSVAERFTPTSK